MEWIKTIPQQNSRQLVLFLLSLLLLVLSLTRLLLKIILLSQDEFTQSFIGYYVASLLLLQGRLGPQVYTNEWFIQQVRQVSGQPVSEIFAPSLPTVSLLAAPFALLPLQPAHTLWLWFNLLALLLGLALLILACQRLAPATPRPRWWWPLLLTFALSFRPALANFEVRQSIILFFCLFTLSLWGLLNRRAWLAGLPLGLAFILKTTGLTLWFLLPLQRRWAALAWGLATILTVALASLPWIGLATWQAYAGVVTTIIAGSPIKAVTAYQTTAGLLTHLLQYDPTWNPQPVYHWPLLASLLTFLISLTALALTLWPGRDHRPAPFLFAALLPLSVVLLPVAEEHHFVILLISIFILLHTTPLATKTLRSPDTLLLGLAILLLIAPIPYKHPALSPGWLALLAYPRLYGGWLIWLVALRRLRQQTPPPPLNQ
jgi:hypothetical protein